jgi:fibronectin-binding autotransporter adhesin
MALNNKGLIDANDASNPLMVQTANGTVNTGTLEATAGGSLVLDGSAFKNTGGTIQANGTGSLVLLENGAVITGGTLSTTSGGLIETASGQTATLNGVTNSGAYVTADNSTTFLLGKITNGGAIQANGAGSLVLLENGAIVTGGTLSTSGGGLIETPGGQTATLSGLTNSGAYVMADNSTTTLSGKITNNGTISLASTGNNTIMMIPTGGATLLGSGTVRRHGDDQFRWRTQRGR